jgi:putative membrane protein
MKMKNRKPAVESENGCGPPPTSKARIAGRLLLDFFSTVVLLWVALRLFPQLGEIKNRVATIWAIVMVAAINILIWPLLIRGFQSLFQKISPALMWIAFPIMSLMLPALLLETVSWLSLGLAINGFGSALIIALFMAFISAVFAAIFAKDDETTIYRWILKRTNKKLVSKENMVKLGLVFLEIDGLGNRVLKDAMNMGKTPNMKRWIDCGSHKLIAWDTDLSSQTSSAQAGILHGNNFGIPAFRWYDKERQNIVVSSSIKDVSQLEKQISDGNGLLSGGGSSRASLLSGDASRVLMTASRPFDMTSDDLKEYYEYFLNPSNILRSVSLMIWELVLEKKAAWSQKLRNEKPRINRGGIYFILRSLVTIFLRDLGLFAVKLDMYSGVPYIYITLAGYDEVSHHSGIKRPDTLEVLRKLDREFGKLEQVAMNAARKYEFVVLSDHGHTQGATFKDRFGESLAEVVRRLVNDSGKGYNVAGYGTRHESAYYIDAAFRDYQLSNSTLGKRIRSGISNSQQHIARKEKENNIVVLASGNLGLISFTTARMRLTFEEILTDYPGLLPGLVEHPGVGFIMIHTSKMGAVSLGKKGKMNLLTGIVEGENPLEDFGSLTRQNLLRTDSFPNAPDILVMSTYWKDKDEVAAFEEQVASHGGMGGGQSKPFVLYPSKYQLGSEKIIGAEALYQVFKLWTNEIQDIKIEGI